MSWSFSFSGTPDKVCEEVSAEADRIAKSYAGKPEGDDILTAKERVVALVKACKLGKDAYGTEWNAVSVSANGSHSTTDGGITSGDFRVAVSRTRLSI
jgi:hypothetical protein